MVFLFHLVSENCRDIENEPRSSFDSAQDLRSGSHLLELSSFIFFPRTDDSNSNAIHPFLYVDPFFDDGDVE